MKLKWNEMTSGIKHSNFDIVSILFIEIVFPSKWNQRKKKTKIFFFSFLTKYVVRNAQIQKIVCSNPNMFPCEFVMRKE